MLPVHLSIQPDAMDPVLAFAEMIAEKACQHMT